MFKYRFFLTIILAILTGLLIVTLTYAGCIETAQKTYERGLRWGYAMRLVSGYSDSGAFHRWAEYFYKGKWRVWDESIYYVGKSWFTGEELGYRTVTIIEEDKP